MIIRLDGDLSPLLEYRVSGLDRLSTQKKRPGTSQNFIKVKST